MKFKLVASDLDGTLLPASTDKISDFTFDVIEKLINIGITFIPVTGRPLSAIPTKFKQIGVEYVIYCNGASVYDLKNQKNIYEAYINNEEAVKILSYIVKHDVGYFVSIKNHNLNDFHSKKFIYDNNKKAFMKEDMEYHEDIIKVLKDSNEDVHKFGIITLGEEQTEELVEELRTMFPSYTIIPSEKDVIEITNVNATKGIALTFLCEKLGISLKETVGLGDSNNDLSFLEITGLKVAPQKCSPNVKELADIICDYCDNDGPAKYLVELLEIDNV